jgi:hypothetical protein
VTFAGYSLSGSTILDRMTKNLQTLDSAVEWGNRKGTVKVRWEPIVADVDFLRSMCKGQEHDPKVREALALMGEAEKCVAVLKARAAKRLNKIGEP